MRRNHERRRALSDAAIEVLAREGARGLTFRAVDSEASVPTGTASNYFANRDELFMQIGARVYDRMLSGVPATAVGRQEGGMDRFVELMQELVVRVSSFPSGHLALIELRLEAIRRPALGEVLSERIRKDIDTNVANHVASGLPGDETSVLLLYLSLNWLILERLTLPHLLDEAEVQRLIEAAVSRALQVPQISSHG
ncbi:TetR/AcrR family transcriptional regulator [Microbacterium halotolerans]|uniref:TetR/AcrR family transcriptional regulator n=1 Tax=Microbacterium halotolerans TaxID=246613 RepID=UPI000E6ADA25|nr:TetR/AcrR family transcriptional regulator [Microbacterium halotolerans]